jgi:hypothetical protein
VRFAGDLDAARLGAIRDRDGDGEHTVFVGGVDLVGAGLTGLAPRLVEHTVELAQRVELTFCDSSGLRALLEIRDRCHRVGTNLRLTNVPANVHRVFELTGTTGVLNIEPN